ncbi:MAG TPA: hypothetical protein VFY15_04280 [Acidimicrobiia bacterium]|nr:hypothetical protein [Acidimicrobiia bacterium]
MPPRSRADRVARSHDAARAAFRLGAGFLLWAVAWAVVIAAGDDPTWWGPLHVFVTGTVLLAISGATQLFSTTWSASSPPDRRLGAIQRWTLAAGAIGVVVGYSRRLDWLLVPGAILVALGLALLGGMLVGVVRRSLLRRFDWATRFYLLALGCGLVGVTLGGVVGAGAAGASHLDLRTAHMHLNLVGLVGFTIVGTIPTLLPTTVHHRMVSGKELKLSFLGSVVAAIAMASGAIFGPVPVGFGAAVAALAGGTILGGVVLRLGVARVFGAGFPASMIVTGAIWLVGWAAHQAYVLIASGHRVFAAATAIGVCGVALVLFGSLAYLVPVLAGPGERLGANFARMRRSGWVRMLLGNAVPVAVVVGLPAAVAVSIGAAFVADFALRVIRVFWRRSAD